MPSWTTHCSDGHIAVEIAAALWDQSTRPITNEYQYIKWIWESAKVRWVAIHLSSVGQPTGSGACQWPQVLDNSVDFRAHLSLVDIIINSSPLPLWCDASRKLPLWWNAIVVLSKVGAGSVAVSFGSLLVLTHLSLWSTTCLHCLNGWKNGPGQLALNSCSSFAVQCKCSGIQCQLGWEKAYSMSVGKAWLIWAATQSTHLDR
jgi:hypothetical protein